jgi:ketosteroid isomerase-like protein
VFHKLAAEWIDYRAEVRTYLADGDQVAAFGVYSGTYRKTGIAMTASFAHLYRLKDGKIINMEQYVDSAMVRQALIKA